MLLLGENTPKTDIFSEKSKWLVLLAISLFKSFIYIGKLNTHPKVTNSLSALSTLLLQGRRYHLN